MKPTALLMPALSDADPVIAGEGSLDPLGLAQIADRLADYLLPGIRARMRRVRFLTASAVGALAADDLVDVVASDGVSSPSISFEWLILEAFARRPGEGAPLSAAGVPGSAKVLAVLAQGNRLAARNYLKSPNVFGFTGVYLPLARHLSILDDMRMPAANITALTRAWEADQGLKGFTDGSSGTQGGQFRSRIRGQILEGLKVGHCAESEGGHLWKRLCTHLHPLRPGDRERALLSSWLTTNDEPVRAWIAQVLLDQPEASEFDLVALLQSRRPPGEVRMRLEAIVAYEKASTILDGAFKQLRHISTTLGTSALIAANCAGDAVLSSATKQLPGALRSATDKIEALDGDLALLLGDRLARFEVPMSTSELIDALMAHHEAIQSAKPPKGKRPWFDRHGQGWVVRSLYWQPEAIDPARVVFVHPYRLASLQTFMKDLA